jgi:hypothetical protein
VPKPSDAPTIRVIGHLRLCPAREITSDGSGSGGVDADDLDRLFFAEGDELVLLEERVRLDLEARRHDATLVANLGDLLRVEVAEADG